MTNFETVCVAIVSLTATSNKATNIRNALAAIEYAASMGASWVVLPEMFAYHGPYQDLWDHAEFEDGPLYKELSKIACNNQIVLFAGSVAERPQKSTEGKVYNTQYVFGTNGELLAKYQKTHLFNLIDPETKAAIYCESDGYLAGDSLTKVNINGWSVGLATCYDLRFSGLFTALNESKGIDCFVIPSAFTLQTGMYHWETLLRARAIEHLCYVVAPNQVGVHSPGKQSYGHGMIVDPWGTVIANTGHQCGVVTAELSKSMIRSCKSRIPVFENQRPALYDARR